MGKGACLYSGSSTIVGDSGIAEMIPDQRIQHVSDRNLGRPRERRRPRIRPPRGVEHGQDPEIDRGDVHPGCESEGEDGRGGPRRTLSRMRWPPRQDKCLNEDERGKGRKRARTMPRRVVNTPLGCTWSIQLGSQSLQ